MSTATSLLRVDSSSLASTSSPSSRRTRRRRTKRCFLSIGCASSSNDDQSIADAYKIPSSVVATLPNDVEIRLLAPYTIAITPYENREEGLSRLMLYIEGENELGEMYPPTQPLTMRYALATDEEEEDAIVGKTMELYLGPRVNPETNPAARTNEKTDTISTRVAGGELVAVVPLIGMATEEAARRCRDVVVREVEKTGAFRADRAGFRVSTFGPMYSLRPRDNEVSLKVMPISK